MGLDLLCALGGGQKGKEPGMIGLYALVLVGTAVPKQVGFFELAFECAVVTQ